MRAQYPEAIPEVRTDVAPSTDGSSAAFALPVGQRSLSIEAQPQLNLNQWHTYVAFALALAALSQHTLDSHLDGPGLAPAVEQAVRPMWPNAGSAVMAIPLLVLSMALFATAIVRLRPFDARQCRLPTLVPPVLRPVPLAEIAIGTGLLVQLWIALRLALSPYDPTEPRLYLGATVLELGGLAAMEWRHLNLTVSIPKHFSRLLLAEMCLAFIMAAAFILISTFDLRSWYYSSIGDEHAFYLASREMSDGTHVHNLFSQAGAYGIIPWFSSYAEGMLMRVLGTDGVGWKTSIILITVAGLIATYALARTLYGPRVAIVTLGFLATSHYLLAYAHTGYPNLETLFPSVAALAAFWSGLRRSSILLLTSSGGLAGLGWYTYYPSRATILIMGIALLVILPWRRWVLAGLPVLAGFGVVVLPLFASSKGDVIAKMLEQTGSGTTTEFAANRTLLPFWNLGRSLLAFNYNTHDGPYLFGSLAEPITACLFALGIGYLVATSRQDHRSRLLVAWFVVGIVVMGVLSKYDYVSVSRLNFLMPVVALAASVALDRAGSVAEEVVSPPVRGYVGFVIITATLGLVAYSNLHRWFVEAPAHVPTSPDSVAIRVIEDPRCQLASQPPLIVDVGIGGAMYPALQAINGMVKPEFAFYGESTDWVQTAPRRCVIFRAPRDQQARSLMQDLETRWSFERPVTEHDRSGIVSVVVYYPRTAS